MVLHSTYQAASTLIQVNREESDEVSLAALQDLKLALKIKDIRWKAGGTSDIPAKKFFNYKVRC